jgi:hypothetical protein
MAKVAPPLSAEGLPAEPVLRRIRIPFVQRAALSVSGVREERFLIDLGLRGVFVERAEALERGEEIELWFSIPGNDIGLHARCRVAWSRRPAPGASPLALPAGVGLEFVTMPDRDADRIRQHLVDYLRRHPTQRRFLRHAEEDDEDA